MTFERLTLARAVPGLEALGVAGARELFEPERALGSRCRELERGAGFRRLRFPLPGTPDEAGRSTGPPAGLGTGWVELSLWSAAPLCAALAARFTHPRSASLAERAWNLSCHLRAHGIGTEEPLAVGARGPRGFARESFLLTRALEGVRPLARWLAEEGPGARRARGLEALAATLAALQRSSVELPPLALDQLWIAPVPEAPCEPVPGASPALRWKRSPGIFFSGVRSGRIRTGARAHAERALLHGLRAERLVTPEEEQRMRGLIERPPGARNALPPASQGAGVTPGPGIASGR